MAGKKTLAAKVAKTKPQLLSQIVTQMFRWYDRKPLLLRWLRIFQIVTQNVQVAEVNGHKTLAAQMVKTKSHLEDNLYLTL
jgi:hypothetical protein